MFFRKLAFAHSSSCPKDGKKFLHGNTAAELLARVTQVNSVSECEVITKKLIALGKPIGVDLEATSESPGLVQVSSSERQVFLFRTGLFKSMFQDGGLRDLLEHPKVLKVMHDATIDCISLFKADTALYPLYDTSVAHKLLEYQYHGKSLLSNNISFNNLCGLYGVPTNPYKSKFSGFAWTKHEGQFFEEKKLSGEVLVYCAHDVDPLLELYEKTDAMIEADFRPFLLDMNECQLIRPFDKALVNLRQKLRSQAMSCDIFLSGLSPSVSKAQLYSILSPFDGNKKVLMCSSKNTAHLIMDSPQIASKVYSFLNSDQAAKVLDSGFQANLLDSISSQIFCTDTGKNEGGKPTQLEHCRELVKRILDRESAVILINFSEIPDQAIPSIEVHDGIDSSTKLDLTDDQICHEIGKIMANPNVVKMAARLDVKNCQDGFKRIAALGYSFENIFDLNQGVKVLDYSRLGTSILRSPCVSLKDMFSQFGISTSCNYKGCFLLYHFLIKTFSSQEKAIVQDRVSELMQISLNTDGLDVRGIKKQAKLKYEIGCLHILSCTSNLEPELIEEMLINASIEFSTIIASNYAMIVQTLNEKDARNAMKVIYKETRLNDGLVRVTDIHKQTEFKSFKKKLSKKELDELIQSHPGKNLKNSKKKII